MSKKFFDRVGVKAVEAYDESYSAAYDYEDDADYIDNITDSLSEAMECLQVTISINKIVTSNKNKLSTEAINLASIAVNNNINRIIPKNKINVTTESIATEGIVDTIYNFLKKIWNAVVAASTWIYEKIATFFKFLSTNHRKSNEKEVMSEAKKSAEEEKKNKNKKKTNGPEKESKGFGGSENTASSNYCENIGLLNSLNCGFEQIDREAFLTLLDGMEKNSSSVLGTVKDLSIYSYTTIKYIAEAVASDMNETKNLSPEDVKDNIEKLYEGLSNVIVANFEELSQNDSLIKSIIYQVDKEYPASPTIHSNIDKMYGSKFLGNMALTTIMYLRDKNELGIKNNIFTLSNEYLGKEHIPKKYTIHEPNLFISADECIEVIDRFKAVTNSVDSNYEEAIKYFNELVDYDKQQRRDINSLIDGFPSIFRDGEEELANNYRDLLTGILELMRKILEILNNLVLKSTVYITKSRDSILQYVSLLTKYGKSV